MSKPRKTNKPKRDIYQEVTDKIIESMESGVIPWQRPWNGSIYNHPTSASSKKTYNGINYLILQMISQVKGYKSNLWMTYQQALKLDGKVSEGEKGTLITYYKMLQFTKADKDSGEEKDHKIPMLKYFTVFNLDQIDGLEDLKEAEFDASTTASTPEKMDNADLIIEATGANIQHDGGSRAFYRRDDDSIHLPEFDDFKGTKEYYSTVFHELTHWTGSPERLDREKGKSFGDKAYAFEELVAEIGASFLCAEVGFEYDTQHTAYLQSWLKALKDDKKLIFKASAQSHKAVNLILKREAEKADSEQAVKQATKDPKPTTQQVAEAV